MTADTKALKELLPKVEAATDRLEDDTLGQIVCLLKKHTFVSLRKHRGHVWRFRWKKSDGRTYYQIWYENHRPDVSLDAVRALAREVLPGWRPVSGYDDNGPFCELFCPIEGTEPAFIDARHPTSERLACLLALMRAKIAEGEAAQLLP